MFAALYIYVIRALQIFMVGLMLLVSIGAGITGAYVFLGGAHMYTEFSHVCPETYTRQGGLGVRLNQEAKQPEPEGCRGLGKRLDRLGHLNFLSSITLVAIGALLFFTSPVIPFLKLNRKKENV